MFNGPIQKCFKVSSLEERDTVTTIEGDVIYVRNYPYVYMDMGNGELKQFTKVYSNISHPKYNMDKLSSLIEPYMFKIEHIDDLNSVPAKVGDLIYRNGDSFMYMKSDMRGTTSYTKILKM